MTCQPQLSTLAPAARDSITEPTWGRVGSALLIAAVACGLVGFTVSAEEPPKGDEAARNRLEFLKHKVNEFVLSTEKEPDKPLILEKEPVLRFANPTRGLNTDAAIFMWLSGGRPAAFAALRIRPDGIVWREFTSISDQSLRCQRDGKTLWAPQSGALVKKSLPKAPEPAATPALRLAQMRRQVERFSAEFNALGAGRWEELRLLPQPLYRYTVEKGAVEGAIFALAQGNDPEAILLLELARPTDNTKPTWKYALVRMSSQPMRARLDDKEVWTTKGYWSNPRSKEDPYQEVSDGKFLGSAPKK